MRTSVWLPEWGRAMQRRAGLLFRAAVAVAAGALCAAPCAQAGTPVNLGVVTWIGYGPIYCAAANGYYKKYGLDVRLVTFSDKSVMAGAGQCGESGATTLNYDP